MPLGSSHCSSPPSDGEFRSSLGPASKRISSVPLARLHCGSVPLVPLDIGLHAQGPGLRLYYSKKREKKRDPEVTQVEVSGIRVQ